MSTFLSQLELNPQIDDNDDEESFEKDDIEREKEIKELLANELNDDEFFEDDRSFTSHQESGITFDSHSDLCNQFHSFPNQQTHQFGPLSAQGPLLTLKGNNFLHGMSPQRNIARGSNDVQDDNKFRERQQKHSSPDTDFYVRQDKLLAADVDVVKKYSENENWKVDTFNSNLDYKNDDIESRQQHLPVDLGKNVQYDGASIVQYDEHQTSFDSCHSQFDGIDWKDNPHGTNKAGSYDNDGGGDDDDDDYSDKKSSLSYGENHLDGYLPNFSDLKQVQAIIDGGHEEIRIANVDDNNNDELNGHDNKQLRILYEVRGRKIEELQVLLLNSQEKHATEIRVLQHKLALITGERDGMRTSLNQLQELVREEREKGTQLEKKLIDEEKRREKLNNERIELAEKLDISESTIESLNQQLTSLNHAESLSRLRSHHEVLMSTLRQKHEEEILHLRDKLDDNRKELNWKIEDVNRLQDELQAAKKFADRSKIESADTINKLSKSLEESQRQLREILEEGKFHEATEARYLLKEAASNKCRLEAENKQFKDKLKDLHEQLKMYEAALEGTISGPSSSTPFIEQNSNKPWNNFDTFKTPISRFERHSLLGDSPVDPIRNELINALANNQKIRNEFKDAKAKIDALQIELENVTSDNKRLEMEIENLTAEKDLADRADREDIVVAGSGETEEIVSDLQSQIKDAKDKIGKLEIEHNCLKDENACLKTEISQMMKDFDRNKIDALKNCEKTYMQLNEDTKRSLQEKLKEEHKTEIETLRSEIADLQNELFDVKESYVTLTSENKALESQVRSECEDELTRRFDEEKNALIEMHKEELRQQEDLLSSRNWSQLEEERKKMKDDLNVELKHRLQTAVSLAKVDWFAGYENEKAYEIENAVKNVKLSLMNDKELEMKQMTAKLKEEFANEKQCAISEYEKVSRMETQKEIQEALDAAAESRNLASDRQRLIAMVFAELDLDETESESCTIITAIKSLKQDVSVCKGQIERLELQAANRKNAMLLEIEATRAEDINEGVAAAKAEWVKEKSQLMQEILKEESQRIRGELLLDFTEDDRSEKFDSLMEYDEDLYGELREFIKYMKKVYSQKLRELKQVMEDQSVKKAKENEECTRKQIKEDTDALVLRMEKETLFEVDKVNKKWQKLLVNSKKEDEELYKKRLMEELERAKNDWKRDLEELQKEHEAVLRHTVVDMQSQSETDQADLKRTFNELLRKIKKDFAGKLEHQKLELETYHSDLTKKTLMLAKKEWELQSSYRESKFRKVGNVDVSRDGMQISNADGAAELQMNNSDSGITSPMSMYSQSTSKMAADPSKDKLVGRSKLSKQGSAMKHTSVQTDIEEDSTLTLQDMRKYYLETVNNIKDDVFKHVKKTKENAAAYFKKQVVKEKKSLLENIRRKFLKILKESHKSQLTREAEKAIFQALEDIDFDDKLTDETMVRENLHPRDVVSDREQLNNEVAIPQTSSSVKREIGNHKLHRKDEKKLLKLSEVEKKLNVMQTSPDTSVISHDSNGTFYTDLPSMIAAGSARSFQGGTLSSFEGEKQ